MTDEELAQLPSPLLEPPPPPSQPPLEAVPSYAPIAPAPVAQGNTRNLQYTFAGPSEAAPYEVFDNGVTTHLLYQNPPATLPLISVMDENNRETPVTVYQKDGYIAVDTVAARLVVRTEGATVYVFNEALSVKR
jgi:type IV secretory pathway VirB9-like protein